MKRYFTLFILFLFSINSYADPVAAPIKGTIKDAVTREEIIGATIIVKGSPARGTVTGLDGSFVLNSIQSYPVVLTVGYLGYKEVDITVNSEQELLDILLDPESLDIETVRVSANSNRGSQVSAIALQKNAMNVLEVVSAKTIEISPDLNVANVLQRVPSVSLERTGSGQAQYAIIRGMEKRYSYTLVNGVKIPSPDNKFRYLPMDLFPADLLDKLVVIKALTPDLEGDAIGGAMDMVMKDAPSKFSVNANAAVGYSAYFFNHDFVDFNAGSINYRSPKELNPAMHEAGYSDFSTGNVTFREKTASPNMVFGLSAGNRFFGDRLGVMLAGSYQRINYGNKSTFIDTSVSKNTNDPFVKTITDREYSTFDSRAGIHSKVDYRFSERHKIDAYFLWVNLKKQEYREAVELDKELANRIEVFKRARLNDQKVVNGTLSGNHSFMASDKLGLKWTLVYSKATQDYPDQVNIKLFQEELGVVENPTIKWNKGSTRRWERNDDRDLTGMVDLTYLAGNFTIGVGGLYRKKDRTNIYEEYKFDPAIEEQVYTGWSDAVLGVVNPLGVMNSVLNYKTKEDVAAVYAMAKWKYRRWEILGGIRYEKTDMSWDTDGASNFYGKTGSRNYYDILPSANIKYALSDKQNLRASYFASLSRPGFFEVIPYLIPGEEYDEAGNPYLKRVQADNIDVRYEFFAGGLDFFTAGVFYKNIKDPIEYSLSSSQLKPENFGDARNMGIEVEATKYFRNFGLRANYSFTDSRITTTKDFWQRRDANDSSSELQSIKVDQTRPLQGQSKHIANLSLLYKNGRMGLDVQLAGIFTGRRIAVVSPYYERDMWQRDMVQLDFSAEKRLYKGIGMYIKAGNLLNSPYVLEVKGNISQQDIPLQDKDGRVVVRKDKFGRNFLVGFRFKL